MKFKTLSIMGLLIFFLFGALAGPMSCNAEPKFIIKAAQVGSGDPQLTPIFGVEWVAKRIEQLTDGEVAVKTYHGTLGSDKDMTEDIMLGTLDLLMTGMPTLSSFIREAGILTFPCIFDGDTVDERYDNAFKVLDGAFGNWFDEKALKKGIRILGWWRNGSISLFTNVPVRKVEDLKGIKIRTLTSPDLIALFKAYGASPVAISWKELYTATQTGVVDGFISIAAAVWSEHMNEVIKYYTEWDQILLPCALFASEKCWKRYPEKVRRAIIQAARESESVVRKHDVEYLANIKQKYIEYGTKVITLTPENLTEFQEIAQKEVWPKFISGEENKDWFQFLRKVQG
jgi:tripartite ATP-independent transporter DctP family solute receptor